MRSKRRNTDFFLSLFAHLLDVQLIHSYRILRLDGSDYPRFNYSDDMTVLEDILAKGEVEEELLVELSDEQKVVLFYKIRQEQIKRWEKHYNNVTDESKVNR